MLSLFHYQISRRTTSKTVFGIGSAALFPTRLSRQISRSIFLYPPAVLSNFDELLKEFDNKRLAWRVGPRAYISTSESILKFAYLSHSLRFPSFIPCSSSFSSSSSSSSSSPLTRSVLFVTTSVSRSMCRSFLYFALCNGFFEQLSFQTLERLSLSL